MEMKIYGNSKDGFFISSEDNREETMRPHLAPCPFCGSHGESLEICNTHTPSFWVECDCGVQMHAFESTPYKKRDLRTKWGCVAVYVRARNAAVNAWNTRDGSLSKLRIGDMYLGNLVLPRIDRLRSRGHPKSA